MSGSGQKTSSSARQRSERRLEDTPKSSEFSSGNQPPKLGLNFTEAAGKVVAFLNIVNDPPQWQGLEIRFTDGTLFHFEFQTPYVHILAEYKEARHGELNSIRNYGLLLPESKSEVW